MQQHNILFFLDKQQQFAEVKLVQLIVWKKLWLILFFLFSTYNSVNIKLLIGYYKLSHQLLMTIC